MLLAAVVGLGAVAPVAAQDGPPRKDAFGDPLPPHALGRIGSTRLRHAHPVTALAFSPDGKILAAADEDGGVRLWDGHTGALVAVLPERRGRPAVLTFSPDGRVLAANDQSEALTLYAVPSGKVLFTVGFRQDPALLVRFAPDGKTLATAAYGRNPVLWDAARGQSLHGCRGEQLPMLALGFADGGATVVGVDNRGAIHRWRADDGTWLSATAAVPLSQAAVSPDGAQVVCGHKDGSLWLRDTATGKEVRRWAAGKLPVRELDFAADGKTVTCRLNFDGVRQWNAATGQERPVPAPAWKKVQALALTPDGTTLATAAGNLIQVWDAVTGKERFPDLSGRGGTVWACALAPDGRTLATLGLRKSATQLWDVATAKPRLTLGDGDVGTRCLAFQPGGRLLATGGEDGDVCLWDTPTGKKQATLRGTGTLVSHVTFTPNGETLVSVTGGDVSWWQVATGQKFRTTRHDAPNPHAVHETRFSPDGRVLAVSRYYPGVSSLPPSEVALIDAATGKQQRLIGTTSRDPATLAFSPDGRLLALGFSPFRGQSVDVVEVATGALVFTRTFKGGDGTLPAPSPVFSVDGRTLLHAFNDLALLANAFTRELRAWTASGHQGWVNSLELSADGRTLATAGNDLTVLLWDAVPLWKGAVPVQKPLSPSEVIECWEALGNKDAGVAWGGVDRLCGDPDRAVAVLKEKVRPVPVVDEVKLARLIADLDDPRFAVRHQATLTLESLGDVAVPPLKKRLADKLSLESLRRVQRLLEKFDTEHSGEAFRPGRAVAVLEHVNTPGARQLLQALAGGAAQARLTEEARAALARLKR
jgi:WD40 repeat protein